MAEEVVAMSVAKEEEEVAKPMVRLLEVVREGRKKRRVAEVTEEEKVVREVRELVVPLGLRAECGGLLRRLGKESVFRDADPKLVARGWLYACCCWGIPTAECLVPKSKDELGVPAEAEGWWIQG